MISIFEERPFQSESGGTREAYLQRLQEIAGYPQLSACGPNGADSGASMPARVEPEAAAGAAVPASGTAWERDGLRAEEDDRGSPEPGAAAAATAPATPAPSAGGGNQNPAPDDLERLTERIVPMVAEALAGVMRELHQHTAADRQRIDAALSAVNDVSQQLRSVAAELSLLRGQMERIGERLNAQEAERRQFAERLSRFEEGQQSHERRLETQAGAIRALHATTSDRGGRREEFQAALRRLEEILGTFSQPVQLPEGL